jgi:tetratricopeptide (TPR) repeat protein
LPVCTDQTIFTPSSRAEGPPWRLLIVGPDVSGKSPEPLDFKGIRDIRNALELLAQRNVPFTAVRMSSTPPEIFRGFPCEFHQAPSDESKSRIYGSCHILIYASHYDSCPRPPQEAMASGVAVVCTATAGAAEYCQDGVNSLLVPIQAPEAIADAVQKLINDPVLRRSLVEGGLATAAQFPREREWDELDALLQRFVSEATAGEPKRAAQGAGPLPQGSPEALPLAPQKNPHEVPDVAKVGSLEEARQLLRRKDHIAAWQQTSEAIAVRPFHPEGYLLLAEIAQAAGDIPKARRCAEQVRQMAPEWRAARKFLKALPSQGGPARVALSEAPDGASRAEKPRLTVCLIAKNEEPFLARCLASVRDVAWQIVLVDTGSTDRTMDIAKEFGAEVCQFEWNDDFSAARNEALRHATGDWIFVIDADEELTAEGREQLRTEIRAARVIAYRLPIADAGKEVNGSNYVPRLFRNAPGAFFLGRIHEQAFSSLEPIQKEWGLACKFGSAKLLHYGYTAEVMENRNKVSRNLRLLRRAVQERPADPNLLMNLGLELMRAGQADEGLTAYREAFRHLTAWPAARMIPELREALLTQLSAHLLSKKETREVIQVLQSPLAKNGGLTATLHFTLGLAFIRQGEFRLAADQMRECLEKLPRPTLTPADARIRGAAPYHCLAMCLARLKEFKSAGKAFVAGFEIEPVGHPIGLDYARFLAQSNRAVDALQLLHRIVTENNSDVAAWQLGGQIALSHPSFSEVARDWTNAASEHHPHDPRIAQQRLQAFGQAEQSESLACG